MINDFGEKIGGARKDVLQSLCNFPLHWEDVSVSSFPLPVRMHLPNY